MGITLSLPPPDTARHLFARTLTLAHRVPRFIPDPAYFLQYDAEALEKAERDAVCAHVMQYRRHLVAGSAWSIEPATDDEEDKRLASILEDAFREIDNFDSARFNLAEAVFTGSHFAFQRWVPRIERFGEDRKPRRWYVCERLVDIDRRRARLKSNVERKRGEPIKVSLEIYSPQREMWVRVERPEVLVQHVYGDAEANLGYGNGLLNALFNTLWAKEEVWSRGLQGVRRWALGMLLAKIDGIRDAQSSRPNTVLAQEWIDFLEKHESQHVGVYDKGDEVEAIPGPSTGHEMVRGWLDYLDNAMRVLCLGSNLPTSADKGGSYNLAEIQQSSTEALIRYDRALLAAAFTRTLVPNFLRYNAANLRDLGLTAARAGRFAITQESIENPSETMQIAQTMLSAGIPLKKEEVYRKSPFTMPAPDDEVFPGMGGAGGLLGAPPVPGAEDAGGGFPTDENGAPDYSQPNPNGPADNLEFEE